MFATRRELLEKICLGEDNVLELKEVRVAGGEIRGPEQAARNEATTIFLARCPVEREDFKGRLTHIMDKRGERVPIILSRSEKLSGENSGIPLHR